MTRPLLLALALVGCAPQASPIDDAHNFGAPPEAGADTDCETGAYGGDPSTQCFARWDCTNEGTLSLICGNDLGSQGTACVCFRDQLPPVVVGTPTSCMDLMVLTEFARAACGWSFL